MGCTVFVDGGPPCLTVKPHPDWSLVTELVHFLFLRFAGFFLWLFVLVCLFVLFLSSSSSSSFFRVVGGGGSICACVRECV